MVFVEVVDLVDCVLCVVDYFCDYLYLFVFDLGCDEF